MIIDIHTHIFPPSVKEKREDFFGENSFRLLYSDRKSKIITAEEIIDAMDENGIDKSVVFGFPWKEEKNYRMNNDYVIEAVKRFPDRLIGFACVDPFAKDAEKEVLRCVEEGLKGVGEIAFYESDITEEITDRLKGIMEICKEFDIPFLLHTNEPVGHRYPGKSPMSLSNLYLFIKKYPENKIILAHWGGGLIFYLLMKKEVKEVLRNVWFDTAASPFLYSSSIYKIGIKIAGKEKILFGSDFPLISPSRYFKEMKEAGLTEDELCLIRGKNAKNLLKI